MIHVRCLVNSRKKAQSKVRWERESGNGYLENILFKKMKSISVFISIFGRTIRISALR